MSNSTVLWLARVLAPLLCAIPLAALAQNVNDGFNPVVDEGVNGEQVEVTASALQSDGKLVIGGTFSHIGSQAQAWLARLNPDGSLDSSFAPTIDSNPYLIVSQAGGKLLIVGSFKHIGATAVAGFARLNADGSLDTSFSTPTLDGDPDSFAVQSDGKIVINGGFAHVNGIARAGIARLNADGTLDAGFIFSQVLDSGSFINTAAIQSDGRILISGGIGINSQRVGAMRLQPNGAVDGSFRMTVGPQDTIFAIAIQIDGKILLGGDISEIDGAAVNHLGRANADGSLDTGFFADVDAYVDRIWLDAANGETLIAGDFAHVDGQARNQFARLLGNGLLDSTFNPVFAPSNTPEFNTLVIQSDNEYVVGGLFSKVNNSERTNIVRLGSGGGSVDDTLNLALEAGTIHAIATEADGNVLIGGSFTSVGGTTRHGMARISPDGGVDSYNPNVAGEIFAIALGPDGSALLGGSFTTVSGHAQQNIAHLESSGTLDTLFDPTVDGFVGSIVEQVNGQILIAGAFNHVNGASHPGLARLNADGSPDTAFVTAPDAAVLAIAPLPNGKILIGGNFSNIGTTPIQGLAQLNADGSVDSSFQPPSGIFVSAVTPEPSGSFLVAGCFAEGNGCSPTFMARMSATGQMSQRFPVAFDAPIGGIQELSDGEILIEGYFVTINSMTYTHLARLHQDGSLDTTFADVGPSDLIDALAIGRDGKIIVGGAFTTIGGQSRGGLARFSLRETPQQSLAYSGNTVTWLRSGDGALPTAPPVLLYSTDLATYVPLGAMTPISGGWQYKGLSSILDQPFSLRVQAPAVGYGNFGASTSAIQYTEEFYVSDMIFADGFGH